MIPKPSTYALYALFFPALISALPLFVLWFFISPYPELNDLMSYLMDLKFFGSVSLAFVFLYFYAQIVRITSKHFENRYFGRDKGFPTTYLMMYEDSTFSNDYKNRFRERARSLIGVDLLDDVGERNERDEARKRLNEAAKLIILKVGTGRLVEKHNMWYGFARNLLGAAPYAILFCVMGLLLGHFVLNSNTLMFILATLLPVYVMVLVFHKPLLFQSAEAYAKQLIAEFMSLK